MGLLDFLQTKRSPGIQTLELKKAFDAPMFVGAMGVPTYPDTDRASLIEWGCRNELVYACIRKKCEAASDPSLFVEKMNKTGQWEMIPNHPLIALMMKPNSRDTWGMFLTQWIQSEELTGDFYAEIVRDRGGVPIALYPLDPSCMFVIAGSNGQIAYYEFRSGYSQAVRLETSDVFHRSRPNPSSRYYGLSPTKVAIASLDADQSQTDYIRAFFHSDGIPAGLLKVSNKSLSKEEANQIQQGWMTKFRRGGTNYKQIAVLDQNAEYQKIGTTLKEIESEVTRGQIEARICLAYGVPAALVGAYVGLKLATNNATMKTHLLDFWQSTMSPLLKEVREWMTTGILTEFESEELIKAGIIRVNWDTDQVMAMQEDEDARHDRARKNFQAGGITINEFRGITGFEPIDGDDYFVQPKNVDLMTEIVRELVAAKEPQQMPAPVAGDTVDGEIVDPKQIGDGKALESVEVKKKTFDYNGLTLSREPNAVESLIDLKGMVDAYDGEKAKINRILIGIRNKLIAQAADAVSKRTAGDVYTLTLTPPVDAAKKLRKEIEAAIQIGRNQVAKDLEAQRGD